MALTKNQVMERKAARGNKGDRSASPARSGRSQSKQRNYPQYVAQPAAPAPSQPQKKSSGPRWLPANPSKRAWEVFNLYAGVYWIGIMAFIVLSGIYESFDEWSYMTVGILIIAPFILYPLFFPFAADKNVPFWQRYWVKANVWIWILSFIGNYLWTHYFYTLLGAKYTMPAHRLNDVPFALFLITHAYFNFYHTMTNMVLRRYFTTFPRSTVFRFIGASLLVLVLSYVTSFMETYTIERFPYYSFKDRSIMYSVGGMCYALYFIVSFPMFYRIEEEVKDARDRWTLSRITIDSFGACMIVTMLLEAWRLTIGSLADGVQVKLPWLYQNQ